MKRLAAWYLVLFALPFPLQPLITLTAPVAGKPLYAAVTAYYSAWDCVIGQAACAAGIDVPPRSFASGDSTWNYLQVAGLAVLAVVAAALVRPGEWVRPYLRFYLAYQMAVYGLMKVVNLQFQALDPSHLLVPVGAQSPMRAVWVLMGMSEGANLAVGAAELLAAVLLTARRATGLGAALSLVLMAGIAGLNYCFDVPVKLLSTHLALVSLYLLAPDLPWLFRSLVLRRPATPQPVPPADRMRVALRTVVVTAFLAVNWVAFRHAGRECGDEVTRPPLYGLWAVESFEGEGPRWRHVVFTRRTGRGPLLLVATDAGKRYHPVEVGSDAVTVRGEVPEPPLVRAGLQLTADGLRWVCAGGTDLPPVEDVYRLRESSPGVVVLEGRVRVRLRHVPEDRFLLTRGFHWVNERDFNTTAPVVE